MTVAETSQPPATATVLRTVRRHRSRRALTVTVLLAAFVLALFVVTMLLGSFGLGPDEVLRSVLGISADPSIDFIVLDLRLPIAVSALTVGMALGASGTLFQQLLRNPLASPDFVGISAGAGLAAVSGIVLLEVSGLGICVLALGGALAAALAMYLLAWKDGVSGYRFILIGIGVSAILQGLIGFLITRADFNDAREAMHWLTGTVGHAGDREQYALALSLLVLLPLAVRMHRQLQVLGLGDDAARGLGSRTERARFELLAVSVVLVALATAVAGPIAFVALVAGPIANRLLGPATGGVLAAALVGASVLLAANLVAVHLLPTELPTGVVTGALGAPYLLWLVATTNKEGAGG